MESKVFDYDLPSELIAQTPAFPRHSSKLMLCTAKGRAGEWATHFNVEDCDFSDVVQELGPQDLIIVNDAKVLPVRMIGFRDHSSKGAVEVLLLKKVNKKNNAWTALMKLSAKVHAGMKIIFEENLCAEVLSTQEERTSQGGEVLIQFSGPALQKSTLEDWLIKYGKVPLPSYIRSSTPESDLQSYQTVYAKKSGSAAAPTAGFHFTEDLLQQLKQQGVQFCELTLHVGVGTFRPIKTDQIEDHSMHTEIYEISEEFQRIFVLAKESKKRIIAVGTTVVRALESWASYCSKNNILLSSEKACGSFETDLFIQPGYKFQIIDDLITNFHLPKSTLLVLVSAIMGVDETKFVYREAVKKKYRFFSYGDAMFIRGRSNNK